VDNDAIHLLHLDQSCDFCKVGQNVLNGFVFINCVNVSGDLMLIKIAVDLIIFLLQIYIYFLFFSFCFFIVFYAGSMVNNNSA